jgi:hypothetical protein
MVPCSYVWTWMGVLLLAASTISAQTPVPNVTVQLDETGIAEWTFQNPKAPARLGVDQSLVFTNETANRTFVVTIPFEFRTGDPGSTFGNANTTGRALSPVALQRHFTMPGFVQAVLRLPDDSRELEKLTKLENLRLLREDIAALKGDANVLSDLNIGKYAILDGGHLEALYWTATCPLLPPDLALLGTKENAPAALRAQLTVEARSLVQRFLEEPQVAPPYCDKTTADRRRTKVLADLFPNLSLTVPLPPPATFDERNRQAVVKQFAASRLKIATDALLAAIDEKIGTAYESSQSVLDALEARRLALTGPAKALQCESSFLRTASTLIGSYGPKSKIPFTSPLLTEDPATACAALYEPPALRPGELTEAMKIRQYNANETANRVNQYGQIEDVGFEIADCTVAEKTTCVARATIPPKQRAAFSRSILERRSDRWIVFTVSFFDEVEPPTNATGYVYLSSKTAAAILSKSAPDEGLPGEVPQKLLFNFGGDGGADYALPKNAVSGHIRRTTGTGSLGFQLSGPFDLSATLQFKKGEFGGPAGTNQVQATQYQAKIFGQIGTILEFGRFVFARPSSSIALAEVGEGLRFSFRRASLGYLVRRESDDPKGATNSADRDSYVLIGQYSAPIRFLRSLLLTGAWGNEKGKTPPAENKTCIAKDLMTGAALPTCTIPHMYATLGFDAKFSTPSKNLVGSLAAYHSVRHVRADPRLDDPAGLNVFPKTNGKGDVALLTLSWSRLVEHSLRKPLDQTKPDFSLAGFLGFGSSDDPKTKLRDESYLGETAGYANDKLFLSNIVETKRPLGHGLANKLYAGVQYTNSRWSPLGYIAAALKSSGDVQSQTTIITLHKYQLMREIDCGDNGTVVECNAALARGQKNAGYEADVDFLIETPKNVRWTIGGAWYRSTRVVRALGVKNNPWIITAGVSIKVGLR